MMDLAAFGETLTHLMARANITRSDLARQMHVSMALVDKWKSTSTDTKQQRRPNYEQVVGLIKSFAPALNRKEAQGWAAQAGYQLQQIDLAAIFPPVAIQPPPEPNLTLTYSRLEPASPHRLFEVDKALENLCGVLTQPEEYWLVSIEGIGGIGKTALANAAVHKILPTQAFHDVVWISAKQQEFSSQQGTQSTNRPALERETFVDQVLEQLDPGLALGQTGQEKYHILSQWLKNNRYLIVIDNLETVADYQTLLPTMRQLAQPSKFLITSRETMDEDIYRFSLGELSYTATLEFLSYMGEHLSLPALQQAPEFQLKGIYDVAGGNPLALKLVIGQLRSGMYALSQILANLKLAQGKTIDELYSYIYWQAWQDLDEAGRRLFVLMPQLPNATAADLSRKSKLSTEALDRAINQLIHRSLVEVRGDLEHPYYYVHRLTETFLLNEVIQWKSLS